MARRVAKVAYAARHWQLQPEVTEMDSDDLKSEIVPHLNLCNGIRASRPQVLRLHPRWNPERSVHWNDNPERVLARFRQLYGRGWWR